jgi:hypothetical protein
MSLNVIVKVDEMSEKEYPFHLSERVNTYLAVVPEQHLFGIGKIHLAHHNEKNRQGRLVDGRYIPGKLAKIILYPPNIFGGYWKSLYYLFPFLIDSFLADVLYHEIGHHYHISRHGIKKTDWEPIADRYSRSMKKKLFHSRGFGKVLFKIKSILDHEKESEFHP